VDEGDVDLLEVYFESNKEIITFCEHLFRYNKNTELYWTVHKDWGNRLQFNDKIVNNQSIVAIAKSMVDVLITHRLSDMMRNIIMEKYYFKNTDEIERILDLSHWIFTGEDDDCLRVKNNQDPSQTLHAVFMENIKNTETVHYDSIVNFRLKFFKKELIHYVGLAIEEFKREEDHQAFINMLREYIVKKEPGYREIYILQGSSFSFFKSNGKKFSTLELREITRKEPLYIVGLDIDELNLSPLIAMAPAKIKIYGDYPSEPKTSTVMNVFQEKVEFEPIRNFPFPHHVKNY